MKKLLFVFASVLILYFYGCDGGDSNSHRVRTHGELPPEPIDNPIPELPKPIVNVYVENSGSMDGYVKGVTEFEQNVYSYLGYIQSEQIAKALNLNYINSKILSCPDDLEDFISKLEPTSFKKKGGDRGTTDMSNLLKTILDKTNDSTVSILVSDFIFSPGRKKNAEEYLVNQQIGLRRQFSKYVNNHPDAAVMMYHFSSRFDGTYYNRNDDTTEINCQRPFYIMLIGRREYLAMLKDVVEPRFASDIKNVFSAERGVGLMEYEIQRNHNYEEDVDRSRTSTDSKVRTIKKLKERKRGNGCSFTIKTDELKQFLVSEAYLVDTANYELNNKDYSIAVKSPSENNENYRIVFTTPQKKALPTSLSLKLHKQVPSWVEKYTDTVGLDVSIAPDKTYGLKYLINGINEGFVSSKSTDYGEIQVIIK